MTRYRNTKRVTQPCRVSVGSNGVITIYAPYNEEFLGEFKRVINKQNRHYDGTRKIHQITPDVLAATIQILQNHFSKIEGLEALIESPYDTLKITPDAPDEMVKIAAKTLRSKYHPDKITQDNYLTIFPDASSLQDARSKGTSYLQEIGEALRLIEESRADV